MSTNRVTQHVVEIFGGLPGVRTGKRVEAVATCRTCGRTGRGKTRMSAKKAIKHRTAEEMTGDVR